MGKSKVNLQQHLAFIWPDDLMPRPGLPKDTKPPRKVIKPDYKKSKGEK